MINYEILAKDLICSLNPVDFARCYLDFQPEDWQIKVLRSKHKRVAMNCSRQSGKSTIAAILAAHMAYYTPNSLTLLFSPSQRQSGELFRKVSDFLRKMPTPPKRIEDNKLSLQLENGARIVSLPGDAGKIRGFSSPDLVIEDEAAQVPDDLHVAIRPTLAASDGRFIILSTPYGRAGHFYDIFTNNNPTWELFTVPATECEHIPQEFLEEERVSLHVWEFDQEYLCKFVGILDQPFEFQHVVDCLDQSVPPLFIYSEDGEAIVQINDFPISGSTRRALYVGVDIGKETSFTAISIIEKVGRGQDAIFNVVHLERLPLGTMYFDQVQHIKSLLEIVSIHPNVTLVVDKTGVGNPIVDFFQAEKLNPHGITITSGREPHGDRGGDWRVPRDDLITTIQFLIQTNKLKIAKDVSLALDLVEELVHFKTSTRSGRKKVSKFIPSPVFDDLAISVMMPLWYAMNGDWRETEFLSVSTIIH